LQFARAAHAALAVLIAITAPIAVYHLDAARISARPHPDSVTLVYVGADDCAPCRNWERDAEPAFRTSPLFSRITYRVVKSHSLLSVLSDDNWPVDLRPFRDQLGPQAGVPLWFVIADGRLLTLAFGETQWRESVVPRMKTLLN
jgi:hypothetical protein